MPKGHIHDRKEEKAAQQLIYLLRAKVSANYQ
jgi:hypothetical protein